MTERTADSIKQTLDLKEAITNSSKPIYVVWIADDGGEYVRSFANESAAVEFERKMDKIEIKHKRV